MLVDKLAYQVVNKSKPIENYNIANIICFIIFQTRMLRCQSVTLVSYCGCWFFVGFLFRVVNIRHTISIQNLVMVTIINHPQKKTEVTVHRVHSLSVTVMHYGIDCMYSIMSTMVLYTTTNSNTMHYKDIEDIFRHSHCVQMTVQVKSN